ncbi:chorismate mutase [Mycobacterium sp. NPDC003449]
MINTARCFVPATAVVLLGMCSAVPMARAGEGGPLYRLVDTAAQRLLTAEPVAAFKWVKGGPIEDSARADKVLDSAGADARKRGLDEQYVRRIFENQIHATEGVEYTRFGQWKFDPAVAPTSAEDLAQSRTAIDRFNRVMVTEMDAQRDVLMGPDCVGALEAARNSVAAARTLDPLYRHALDVATSSYCGWREAPDP